MDRGKGGKAEVIENARLTSSSMILKTLPHTSSIKTQTARSATYLNMLSSRSSPIVDSSGASWSDDAWSWDFGWEEP